MDNKQYDSRWIRCPICDSKTRTKVYSDTVMFNFPLYCPKCKSETKIDVLRKRKTYWRLVVGSSV